MKWFKFYGQDWLTDSKILSLSVEDKVCFLTLLCMASAIDKKGEISNCSEDVVLHLANFHYDPMSDDCPYNRAKGFLARLHDNKMITFGENNSVIILNFERRQGENLSGYERVKRYREKKNKAKNKGKNQLPLITNDNVRDNEDDNVRIDKNRIEEKRLDIREEEKPTPSEIAQDFFKKGETFSTLQDLFCRKIPEAIVLREFDKFILYWTEPNKSGTKVRWQQQGTFEIKRRLITWFNRVNDRLPANQKYNVGTA